MKYCKKCGKQVSDATVFCPSCNEPVASTSESSQFIPNSEDYYIIKSSAKKSRTIMILAVCSLLFCCCSGYIGLLFTAGVFVMARNLNIPGEDVFSRPQSEIAEIKRVRRRVLIAKIIALVPLCYVAFEILLSVVIYLITLLPAAN